MTSVEVGKVFTFTNSEANNKKSANQICVAP